MLQRIVRRLELVGYCIARDPPSYRRPRSDHRFDPSTKGYRFRTTAGSSSFDYMRLLRGHGNKQCMINAACIVRNITRSSWHETVALTHRPESLRQSKVMSTEIKTGMTLHTRISEANAPRR